MHPDIAAASRETYQPDARRRDRFIALYQDNYRNILRYACRRVAYSGLPTQYLVVFDAKTGQLLDSEQILNKRAGLLNIPVPSVISYDLFVKSGVTNHD